MQYRRLTHLAMMSTEDENTNVCSMMGNGWETVPLDTDETLDNEEMDQIRGWTSTYKTRICAKFSEKHVEDNKFESQGRGAKSKRPLEAMALCQESTLAACWTLSASPRTRYWRLWRLGGPREIAFPAFPKPLKCRPCGVPHPTATPLQVFAAS